MAEKITMPRLSDTMEEGTVVKWHKKVGDKVSEGDILAEIETDKAIQEFESEYEGVLLYQGVEEGKSAKVDTVLAVIGDEGEEYTADESPADKQSEDSEKKENSTSENSSDKEEEKSEENIESEASNEIPEGVNVITMPRLSDTMEEGTVAKWHKKVGDNVSEGDILAEIETDKAVQEFESEYDGTLLYIGAEEGKSAPVDTVLAIIGTEGTDVSGIASTKKSTPKKETKKEEKKEEPKVENIDTATPNTQHPTPNTQHPTSDTQHSTPSQNERIFASPLAKSL